RRHGTEKAAHRFAVGDVKQSIFSFQGAEPASFIANRNHFAERVSGGGGQFRQVDMTVSFRSTAAVLSAVDAVFARADASEGVALDNQPIRHQVSERRRGDGGVVEIWPEVKGRQEDAPEPWRPPIDRVDRDMTDARMARLIAGRIARMVNGEILASQGRAIRPAISCPRTPPNASSSTCARTEAA
ncbi:MAG: UvrD-helicase domain-containing protein, partial [Rhodospirillales bacterium]|nr:UvrD-helicase domain-containing protein [Rhodospirillales bacterium]